MARLRFPGRPGYRFDRIGVRYGVDEARQTTDPSLAVVASIHKGLQRFRDLFGDSDEDEDFHGFTQEEVKSAERQLLKYQRAEREFLERQAQRADQGRFARSQAALASFAAAVASVGAGSKSVEIQAPGGGRQRFGTTFKKILNTGLVTHVDSLSAKSTRIGKGKRSNTDAKVSGNSTLIIRSDDEVFLKENGSPVRERVTSIKHVKLKRLTHTVEGQVVFRRPVGRPRKTAQFSTPSGDANVANGGSVGMSLSSRPSSKYRSAAQQLLARATKLHHTGTVSAVAPSSHHSKVRKFVLPTKSSRSSRLIKPNKRFLEEGGSKHTAILTSSEAFGKQARLAEAQPTAHEHFISDKHPKLGSSSTMSMLTPAISLMSSSGDAPQKTSFFGVEVGDEKSCGLGGALAPSSVFPSSPFLHHSPGGLTSLSPFSLNREKGFPAFSTAPQPSGTTSFTDKPQCQPSTSSSTKALGALDQPLIVQGKRPRKPSLIMRMKLVEDDPEDEIRLQQSMLADTTTPPKSAITLLPSTSSLSTSTSFDKNSKSDSKLLDKQTDMSQSSSLSSLPLKSKPSIRGYGATKSLIAPAKLFTNISSLSSAAAKASKSRRHRLKASLPAQQTVILRQAKLQLNRAALNRSKAALARSLKATLKREAKLERRKRFSLRKQKKSGSITTKPALEGKEPLKVEGALSPSSSAVVPSLSPGASTGASSKLSQLSPFSLQTSEAMIEKSKQGLFQTMEEKIKIEQESDVSENPPPPDPAFEAASSPATFKPSSSPTSTPTTTTTPTSVPAPAPEIAPDPADSVTLSSMKTRKKPGPKPRRDDEPRECKSQPPYGSELNEGDLDEYFESLVSDEDLLKHYELGSKWKCLVCEGPSEVKANRKLPNIPLCRPCKKAYFFQLSKGVTINRNRRCVSKDRPNQCGPAYLGYQRSNSHCTACKYRRFCGVLRKAKKIGLEAGLWTPDYHTNKSHASNHPTVKWKDFIRKGPKKSHRLVSSGEDTDFEDSLPLTTPKKRHRTKSGDFSGSEGALTPGKTSQRGRRRSLSGGGVHSGSDASEYARQRDVIQSKHLDQPLSVDVGDTSGSFTLSPPQTVSSTKSSPGKSGRTPSKKAGHDNDGSGFRQRSSRGPRIKHVCRRAAMVFPGQRATFPGSGLDGNGPQGGKGLSSGGVVSMGSTGSATLTLSALPNAEKEQVLARTKLKKEFEKYSSSDDSEDERRPRHRLQSTPYSDKKLGSKGDRPASWKRERKFSFSSPSPLKENNADSDIKDYDDCDDDEDDDDGLREDGLSMDGGEAQRARAASVNMGNNTHTSSGMMKNMQFGQTRPVYKSYKKRERRLRCRKCKGCLTPECGNCTFCRDKPKYGGKGVIKKTCIHSQCLNLRRVRQATDAFIEPKSPEKFRRPDNNDDDNNGGYHHSSWNNGGQASSFRSKVTGRSNGGSEENRGMNGRGKGANDAADGDFEMLNDSCSDEDKPKPRGPGFQQVRRGLDMDGSQVALDYQRQRAAGRFGAGPAGRGMFGHLRRVNATVQFALADPFHRLGRGGLARRMAAAEAAFVGKMKRKKKDKKGDGLELKPVERETAYTVDVPLTKHLITADYQEEYDVETAWSQGYSLTVTGPSCVRSLCFLCGSAGKHQMIFCIVCCQSFHNFCLEEEERPEEVGEELVGGGGGGGDHTDTAVAIAEDEGDDCHQHHSSSSNSNAVNQHRGSNSSGAISWCCRRCQFCHVCGQQNGLLKCHRCRDTYHPECLGPNYPTKPSRKNIWVCTKCVRCKSCGATTPGVGTNATWTYDFSLCHECGKLMDKGNFCPICHKCYSDDDWESKMIQCSGCESWVHAKCEELTDEMYQLIACLPEDIHYRCRVCAARDWDEDDHYTSSQGHKPLSRSSYWQKVLRTELLRSLLNVMSSLLSSKCAQVLHDSAPPRESRRPKAKQLEVSKTLTVKEVCELKSDGQPSTNLPETVTINLDGDGDPRVSTVQSTLCHDTADSSAVSSSETQPSPTSGAVTTANTICKEAQDRDINLRLVDLESSGKGLLGNTSSSRMPLTRTTDSLGLNIDSAGADHVKPRPFDTVSLSLDMDSTNRLALGASKFKPSGSVSQGPNSVIVSLDSEEEIECDDAETKCGIAECVQSGSEFSVAQTHGNYSSSVISTSQSNPACSQSVETKTATNIPPASSALASSSSSVQCSPSNSRLTTEKAFVQSSLLCHSSTINTVQNKPLTSFSQSNSLEKAMPKLSALLSSGPSVVRPAVSFNTIPDKASVSKTLFQASGDNAKSSELLCASLVNELTPTQPSAPSSLAPASDRGPAKAHETTAKTFYSEFLKSVFPDSKSEHGDSDEKCISDNPKILMAGTAKGNNNSSCSSDGSHQQTAQASEAGEHTEKDVICNEQNLSSSSSTLSLPSSRAESPQSVLRMESVSTSTSLMTSQSVEGTPTKHRPGHGSLSVSFDSMAKETHSGKNGQYPTDFLAVRDKIGAGSYSTVEEFSEDMVRIIQALLFENQNFPTRRKQANSVRSIFIKQMERIFPWFNVNTCKLWEHNRGLPEGMLSDAVLPPSTDHTYAQWLERQVVPMNPQPSPFKKNSTPQRHLSGDGHSDGQESSALESVLSSDFPQEIDDTRTCLLCGQRGDDLPDNAGRLLYCGQDDWVHINCALWSAEVFEEFDGSLQNVMEATARGKKLRCNLCQEVGATVGCCATNCRANYHFMCARKDGCVFEDNRIVYCKLHVDEVDSELIQPGHFAVLRRVCVDLNKIRAKSNWGKAVDPSTLSVLIGSCTIESLGVLKSYLSDTEECLLPVDFCCTRIYWSTQDARRRCVYTCRIVEVRPSDLDSTGAYIQDMRIVHDPGHPDFVPLEQLNLENSGVPNFQRGKSESESCSGTEETLRTEIKLDTMTPGIRCPNNQQEMLMLSTSTSITSLHLADSNEATQVTTTTSFVSTQTTVSFLGGSRSQRAASWSHYGDQDCFMVDPGNPHGEVKPRMAKDDKLEPSPSSPSSNLKDKQNTVDLSCLSPSTLALLNIKDPKQYVPSLPRRDSAGRGDRSARGSTPARTCGPAREEELGLVKIAERLNRAASWKPKPPERNRRSSSSPLASARRRAFTPLPRSPHIHSYLPHPQLQTSSDVYAQYQLTKIQHQRNISRGQSVSPVAVMSKSSIRPRSNSEELQRDPSEAAYPWAPSSKAGTLLKPLPKERKVILVFPNSVGGPTEKLAQPSCSSEIPQPPAKPRAAFRARSESPFTVISTLDTGPKIHDFRSASLSPPPVTRGAGFSLMARSGHASDKPQPGTPQTHVYHPDGSVTAAQTQETADVVLNNDDEKQFSLEEGTCKQNDLDCWCTDKSVVEPRRFISPSPEGRSKDGVCVSRQGSTLSGQAGVIETIDEECGDAEEVLSSESIQSLLESVPQEVLEGEEDVQLVVLPAGSTEGLSEEDVVRLAQSVVSGGEEENQDGADQRCTDMTGCDGVHGCGENDGSGEGRNKGSETTTGCDGVHGCGENGGSGEGRNKGSETTTGCDGVHGCGENDGNDKERHQGSETTGCDGEKDGSGDGSRQGSETTRGCDGVHGCGENDGIGEERHQGPESTTECDGVHGCGENDDNGERKQQGSESTAECDGIHGCGEEKNCDTTDKNTPSKGSVDAETGGDNNENGNGHKDRHSSAPAQHSSSNVCTGFRAGGQGRVGGGGGRGPDRGGDGGDRRREPQDRNIGCGAQDKADDSGEENISKSETPEVEEEEESVTSSGKDNEKVAGLCNKDDDEVDGKLSPNVIDLNKKAEEDEEQDYYLAEREKENKTGEESSKTVANGSLESKPVECSDSILDSTDEQKSPSGVHSGHSENSQPKPAHAGRVGAGACLDAGCEGEADETVIARGDQTPSNSSGVLNNVSSVTVTEDIPTEEEECEEGEEEMEIIDLSDPDRISPQGQPEKDLASEDSVQVNSDAVGVSPEKGETLTCGSTIIQSDLSTHSALHSQGTKSVSGTLSEQGKDCTSVGQLDIEHTSSADSSKLPSGSKSDHESSPDPASTLKPEGIKADSSVANQSGDNEGRGQEKDVLSSMKRKKKHTCKVYINRQDMTDEESDYLMLDDFSYSETTTNDGEEDVEAENASEIELSSNQDKQHEASVSGNKRTTEDDKSGGNDFCSKILDGTKNKVEKASESSFPKQHCEGLLPPDTSPSEERNEIDADSTGSVTKTLAEKPVALVSADVSLKPCSISLQREVLTDRACVEERKLTSVSSLSVSDNSEPALHVEKCSDGAEANHHTSMTSDIDCKNNQMAEGAGQSVVNKEKEDEDVDETLPNPNLTSADVEVEEEADKVDTLNDDENVLSMDKHDAEGSHVSEQITKSQDHEQEDGIDNNDKEAVEITATEENKMESSLEKGIAQSSNGIQEESLSIFSNENTGSKKVKDFELLNNQELVETDTARDVPAPDAAFIQDRLDAEKISDRTSPVNVQDQNSEQDIPAPPLLAPEKPEPLAHTILKVDAAEVPPESTGTCQPSPGNSDDVRERVLENIKAKGLSRSGPGEEGPFKCPTCKRMYRTLASFECHVKDCDFDVSTSDEDENTVPLPEKRELRPRGRNKSGGIASSSDKMDSAEPENCPPGKASPSQQMEIVPGGESEKETFERMRQEKKGMTTSPLNEPLSIIINDEMREGSASSRDKDLSDDCSSQDSRRSSLRRSTVTQRNAAPAHLAKQRFRDAASKSSPDGSTATPSPSPLLSPRRGRSSSFVVQEEKPSPKETMLEAVGLVSKRALELSPNSDAGGGGVCNIEPGSSGGEQTCAVKLQPRFSPTTMAAVPKREKRNSTLAASAASLGAAGKPSIMAGGKLSSKQEQISPRVKSVSIVADPVVVTEVSIGPTKKPRKKRIWWVEATESSEEDEGKEMEEDPLPFDDGGGVARRTRHGKLRLSEEGGDMRKSQKQQVKQEGDAKLSEAGNSAATESAVQGSLVSTDQAVKGEDGPERMEDRSQKERNVEDDNTSFPMLRSSRRRSSGAACGGEDKKASGNWKHGEECEFDTRSIQKHRIDFADKDVDEVDSGELKTVTHNKKQESSTPPPVLDGDEKKIDYEEGKECEEKMDHDNVADTRDSQASHAEDGQKSPIRRSCRPSSKTAKLSEFLANLKKEKEAQDKDVEKREQDGDQTSAFTDVAKERRGRGRPRIYPLKEKLVEREKPVEILPEKKGRGRPRIYPRPESGESKEEKPETGETSNEDDVKLKKPPRLLRSRSHLGNDSIKTRAEDDGDDRFADENDGNNVDGKGGHDCKENNSLDVGDNMKENENLKVVDMDKTEDQNNGQDSTSKNNEHLTREEGDPRTNNSAIDEQAVCTKTVLGSEPETEKVVDEVSSKPEPAVPKNATDMTKVPGQRLRIIVRSPNVLAAQKVGELLKKTAQSINPDTSDITVTTDHKDKTSAAGAAGAASKESSNASDGCKHESAADKGNQSLSGSPGMEEHTADLNFNSATGDKPGDATTAGESRSVSPDSVSAAYDIQSDDFSSETSNDTEDFVPRPSVSIEKRKEEECPSGFGKLKGLQADVTKFATTSPALQPSGISTAEKRVSVLPALPTLKNDSGGKMTLGKFEDNNNDDDDDDVMLVKAVGLQPLEPSNAGGQACGLQPPQPNIRRPQSNFPQRASPVSPSHQHSSPHTPSPSGSALTNASLHRGMPQHSGMQLPQQQGVHVGFISSSPGTASKDVQPPLHVVSNIPQQQRIMLCSEIQPQRQQQQPPTLSPPQAAGLLLQNLAAAANKKSGGVLLSANSSPVQPGGAGLIFPNASLSGLTLSNQSGLSLQAGGQSGIPLQGVNASGIAFQAGSQPALALQVSSPQALALQTSGQAGIALMGQPSPAGVVLGPGQGQHLQGLVQGSITPAAQHPGFSIISLGGTPTTILSPLQALQQQQQQLSQGSQPQGLSSTSPTLLPNMSSLTPLVGARVGQASPPNHRPIVLNQSVQMAQPPQVFHQHHQHQSQQIQHQQRHQSQQVQQHHKILQQDATSLQQHRFSHLQQQQQERVQQSIPTTQLATLLTSPRLLSPQALQCSSPRVQTNAERMWTTPQQTQMAVPAHHPSPVPMPSAPRLTHVDGTPAQVNYMGTFDLNSSTLQAVMSGQGITQNTTQMIKDLVQRALKSGGREFIPGVEVKSAITDTPQGPKKVLRVFINEDILPIQRGPVEGENPLPQPPSLSHGVPTPPQPANTLPTCTSCCLPSPQSSLSSLQGQQQVPKFPPASNIAAVAAASLQPLRRSVVPSLPSQQETQQPVLLSSSTNQTPNWSKLLEPLKPQQFPGYQSKTLPASKASNSDCVSKALGQQQQQVHRNLKPQAEGSGSNFRKALKPAVCAPAFDQRTSGVGAVKRKGSSYQESTVTKRARAVFEKTRLEDGNYSGTLGGCVSRSFQPKVVTSLQQQTSAVPCSRLAVNQATDLIPPHSLQLQREQTNSITDVVSTPTPSSVLQPSNASLTPSIPVAVDKQQDTTPLESSMQHHHQFSEADVPERQPVKNMNNLHDGQQQQQQHKHQIPLSSQAIDSPLQRASFQNSSAESAPTQQVSLASKVRLTKHILKKASHRKDALSTPGAARGARPKEAKQAKGVGRKAALARKTKLGSHHPLIHHNKKSGELLPQHTLEEEVVATPLDLLSKGEHPGGGRGPQGRCAERNQSVLRFEISSDDGFSCQGNSMEDAWNQVLEKVQDVRAACRMKQLSYAGVSGRNMSGLENNTVVYLLEQLYGAVHCHQNYKFRFHKYDLDQADAEVTINQSGSARSEAFSTRKPFDMFNFLKSVYRTRPGDEEREKEEEMSLKSSRRATSLSLPMAMRFRKLKTFAKEAVDVYRSKIHGRGLFCKRNIDAGEMVIEYAGEVIRASLTDKREKYYEGKGIGCYMFRIDDDEVVDATMHGSAARFINHSCEPNCFSKVILVEGKKHIVIFAMRPIKRGEELTYDYKFPIEEVKIPCSCGSKRCRKYLN